MKKGKILGVAIALILLAGAGFFLHLALGEQQDATAPAENNAATPSVAETTQQQTEPQNQPQSEPQTQTPAATPAVEKKDIVLLDVPFVSQAPLAQWSNPLYQNACEEAAILMAHLWTIGAKPISANEATTELAVMSAFEDSNFGFFYDLSTPDTAELMQKYYNYDKITVKDNITAQDMINELQKGNVLIVPMNGQELNNPYYTAPGPAEHKILVKGYDFNTKEFITNDPGTRHGENYRYPEDVFFNAIREYPTGYKEPITSIEKMMMVVSK